MKNISRFVKRSILGIVASAALLTFPQCSDPQEEYPFPAAAQNSVPSAELPSFAV